MLEESLIEASGADWTPVLTLTSLRSLLRGDFFDACCLSLFKSSLSKQRRHRVMKFGESFYAQSSSRAAALPWLHSPMDNHFRGGDDSTGLLRRGSSHRRHRGVFSGFNRRQTRPWGISYDISKEKREKGNLLLWDNWNWCIAKDQVSFSRYLGFCNFLTSLLLNFCYPYWRRGNDIAVKLVWKPMLRI